MGGLFSLMKKAFLGGNKRFWANLWEVGLFYMGSNDQIMQGGTKSFTNTFSSNLNSVNLKIFHGHGGRHT